MWMMGRLMPRLKKNWSFKMGDNMNEMMDVLNNAGYCVSPCGSRVTCDPIPECSDYDFLVKVPCDNDKVADIVSIMSDYNFDWEGGDHYQDAASTFMSWRNNETNYNMIITRSKEFHAKHLIATKLCKKLNLLIKADRISLFQEILYGNDICD